MQVLTYSATIPHCILPAASQRSPHRLYSNDSVLQPSIPAGGLLRSWALTGGQGSLSCLSLPLSPPLATVLTSICIVGSLSSLDLIILKLKTLAPGHTLEPVSIHPRFQPGRPFGNASIVCHKNRAIPGPRYLWGTREDCTEEMNSFCRKMQPG